MAKVKFSNGLVLTNKNTTSIVVKNPKKGIPSKAQLALISILNGYIVSSYMLVELAKAVSYIDKVIAKGDNATIKQVKKAKSAMTVLETAVNFLIEKPYLDVELEECDKNVRLKITRFLVTRNYEDYTKIRAYF